MILNNYDEADTGDGVTNTPEGADDSANFYDGKAGFDDSLTDWSFKPNKGGCAPYQELTPERFTELAAYYTAKYPERHK